MVDIADNRELPEPYKLKHTSMGWWIDGYCGYCYVGYFNSEKEAVEAFWEKYWSE